MRALSFRNRISLALLLLGVPSAVAVFGWAYTTITTNTGKSAQIALRPVRRSGQQLVLSIDTTALAGETREAFRKHLDILSQQVVLAERAAQYQRLRTIGYAIALAVLGALLIAVSLILGWSLSRQLSRPIEELIGWTGHIRRNEPLPEGPKREGAPEFSALRVALRDLSGELDEARRAELERERLRTFREIARRVAHEMKNPLTPIRFAVASLGRHATPEQAEALEVLQVESSRLELLAREFATLGRLPEGPPSEIDLGELLTELVRTSMPPNVEAHVAVADGAPRLVGHYDPLHRAFANVLRNAVEAMSGKGRIDVTIRAWEGGVRVGVADQGPGIPSDKRTRVFEPYFTEKSGGTGLGLSIVKQAIDLHQGQIDVFETPGGGATFVVWLPLAPESARTRPQDRPFVERRVAERRRDFR